MRKKLLCLLMVLAMVFSTIPATAFAAGGAGGAVENCTVTVNFDISSLGTDEALSTLQFAQIPSGTVTVPKGSTLEDALDKLGQDSQDHTFTKATGMITAVNHVTGKTEDNFFANMLQSLGVSEPVPTEFQYAGWMYSGDGLPGMGINSDTIEKNTTVNFRYTLYFGAASNTEWKNFDWEFVDAYKALKAKVAEVPADLSGYTQDEQDKVNEAKNAANNLLTTIDSESQGIWAAYIATKKTALWGPNSVTDQLQKSLKTLTNAINKVPSPTEVQVTGTTGDGKPLAFSGKETVAPGTTVQLNAKVLPEGANQEVTFEVVTGAGVSVSTTGLVTCDVECSMAMIQVKSKEDPDKMKNVMLEFAFPKYAVTFKGNEKVALSKGCITLKQGSKSFNGIFNNAQNTIKFDVPAGEYDYEVKTVAFTEKGKVLVTDKAVEIVFADGQGQRAETLMDNIAKSYVDNSSEWQIMDMAAYLKYKPGTANKTSDKAKQNFINKAIKTISTSTSDTALDKAIIGLRGLNGDITKLYPVNANTPISAIDKLNAVTHSSSAWSAPYTMAAYNQGVSNKEKEDALITEVLKNQKEDGSWNEYGTIDTTANVIAGLSFYKDRVEVQTAIDKAVTYLAGQQKPNGAYDGGYGVNSNSTAMVIVGLAAAGVNPETDARFIKNGNSVLDGLMTFALADNSGFGYTNNTQLNASGTEQSFRALIAAANVMKTGAAYNVYDFSTNAKEPIRATGDGTVDKPTEPEGDNITVKMTIKADNGYWLNNAAVTIPGTGAKVYHAFVKACKDADITYVGAESGYVRSITKDGRTLKEFDKGPNSGWMYKVNGELPTVGLTAKDIVNGDNIVWFYTDDWKNEPGVFVPSESKPPVTSSGQAGTAVTTSPTEVTVAGGTANVTVKPENAAEIFKQAQANKSTEIVLEVAAKDTKGAETVKLQLDAAFVKQAEKAEVAITVDTANGKTSFDSKAVDKIAAEAKGAAVTIEVTKVSKPTEEQSKAAGKNGHILKLTVKYGDKTVSDFGLGRVTVTVEIPSKLIGRKVAAVHIADSGKLEQLAGKLLKIAGKQHYEFVTPHFSTFALVDAEEIGLESEKLTVEQIKENLKSMKFAVRSSKTAKKNVIARVKLSSTQKEKLKEIEAAGYDVKYHFYRSALKSKKYQSKLRSEGTRYVNTAGKYGKSYYYKARIQVYDEAGKLVAKTSLNQCKYAARMWTKKAK